MGQLAAEQRENPGFIRGGSGQRGEDLQAHENQHVAGAQGGRPAEARGVVYALPPGLGRVLDMDARLSAAERIIVHDVVMDEEGRVEKLHGRGRLNRVRAGFSAEPVMGDQDQAAADHFPAEDERPDAPGEIRAPGVDRGQAGRPAVEIAREASRDPLPALFEIAIQC